MKLEQVSQILKSVVSMKLFGRLLGGIKGLLFSFAWEKLIVPLMKYASQKIGAILLKIRNDKKIDKLKEAKNEDEFNSAVDNLP